MSNLPDSPSSKPRLEDLLRLKRAERPDAAFWSDFEVNLRQRQLAAIIEPKPWWLGASLVFRRFSFPMVALGSGAAALLAFTVIRNGGPVANDGSSMASVTVASPQVASIEPKAKTSVAAALPVEMNAFQEVVPVVDALADQVGLIASVLPTEVSSRSNPVATMSGIDAMAAVEIPAVSVSADIADQVTFTEVAVTDAAVESFTMADAGGAEAEHLPLVVDAFPAVPFERDARGFASVSWNAERVVLPESDFVDLVPASAATFAINASSESEDSTSITGTAEPGSRFERLLSADATRTAVNSSGSFAQVRDRVLHHLGSDEELYASVSRLGLGGDRLSLRF